MSEEHVTRANPLECRLMSASLEIDDDDEDIIQVTIEISNEAAMPIGSLDVFIQTSDNKKVSANEGISSLGPGLTRKFTFEFPLVNGEWTFMLRSPSIDMDLGPYAHDFTYQIEKGRIYNNAVGSGMFTDAFTSDLGDFGKVEERGVIDASTIRMTSYFGENSAGGTTAITVGTAPANDPVEGDAPRTPPWQQSSDPLLSTLTSTPTESTSVENKTEPVAGLLAFSKQVGENQSTPNPEMVVAATPPPLPPGGPSKTQQQTSSDTESPHNSPPTQPPTGPPSGAPSKPPTAPPSGPPSGPPSKPPTAPPSSPPSGPPSKPPTGPPSSPPTGPPTGPPSGPPGKPPTGPPSGPPKSKKPTRPPM